MLAGCSCAKGPFVRSVSLMDMADGFLGANVLTSSGSPSKLTELSYMAQSS